MKTLYAYCPSCKIQVRVDTFAGSTTYHAHGNGKGEPCRRSGQECHYVARDHFAGANAITDSDVTP